MTTMKLGVFDSGLGGLLISRAIADALPDLDMLYYGDTLHLPYGNRSEDAIYDYTRAAMDYMFAQGCVLIIIACNTASASALRRLQQTWLPGAWPGRNILGVVVPTLEEAISRGYRRIGLIGTHHTVRSKIYEMELQKINPDISIVSAPTPLLVPLIELGGIQWIEQVLDHYLKPIIAQGIESLILGCTHYALLKDQIRRVIGSDITLLSQDEIVPRRLAVYLDSHPEYADRIGRKGLRRFEVSDITENYKDSASLIYGANIQIMKAEPGMRPSQRLQEAR